MTMTLTDPKKLELLSKDVASSDLDAPWEAFIQSLSFPPDEESAMMDSLKILPDRGVSPSALPKNPPILMGHNFWF